MTFVWFFLTLNAVRRINVVVVVSGGRDGRDDGRGAAPRMFGRVLRRKLVSGKRETAVGRRRPVHQGAERERVRAVGLVQDASLLRREVSQSRVVSNMTIEKCTRFSFVCVLLRPYHLSGFPPARCNTISTAVLGIAFSKRYICICNRRSRAYVTTLVMYGTYIEESGGGVKPRF